MRKDLKTGMLTGSAIAALLTVWAATRPNMTVAARARQQYQQKNAAAQQAVKNSSVSQKSAGVSAGSSQTQNQQINAATPASVPQTPAAALRPLENPPQSHALMQQIHIVAAGETLTDISQKYYGTASKWNLIYQTNKNVLIDGPDRIRVGMRLIIPAGPAPQIDLTP